MTCVALVAALAASDTRRLALAGVALLVAGLWWGALRGEALDRSYLADRIGETASAQVVVTGPARTTPFAIRVPAEVRRFGTTRFRERVLLELPPERAPPQGAVLELRARPVAPRGPETGFDERGWLARRGVHVVLRGEGMRIVGRRGGIGGVADRLRAHVESTLARGTTGERRALLAGIVLGEDSGIDAAQRDAFEASGLMHLLAVSGQNMAITAIGVVTVARVVGVGRLAGEGVAILVVLSYALAVGWQPSVVRAAVAGVLASLAWIVARPRDRWHALAVGALVLLCWLPASALEPGFQLSFAAVAAIFVVLPRVGGVPDAYPVPRGLWDVIVVAVACGVVTAPIVWLHFGAVALWTVPANVAAEPAMPPLIGLSLAAAAIEPVLPGAAAALAWLAGWCAAWIAFVADVVSAWPSAQLRSPVALDRRPLDRRDRLARAEVAALPAPRCGGRRRLGGAGAGGGGVRVPTRACLVAAERAPADRPRRRPGRRDPRRGARCVGARRPGATGGGRGRPARPARDPVADGDRPHAPTA